jgi:hypothetical protein
MMMMMMMLQGGQSFTYINLSYSEHRALFPLAQSSRAVLFDVKAKHLPQYLSEGPAQCSGHLYSEKKMRLSALNKRPY